MSRFSLLSPFRNVPAALLPPRLVPACVMVVVALFLPGCVGSPAGSIMSIASGFDPTGVSGMVASQVMMAEQQALVAQRQEQAMALVEASLAAAAHDAAADRGDGTPLPPPSSAEQAAINALADAAVGASIAWTDAASHRQGRVSLRSVQPEVGGLECRIVGRIVEAAGRTATGETTLCVSVG